MSRLLFLLATGGLLSSCGAPPEELPTSDGEVDVPRSAVMVRVKGASIPALPEGLRFAAIEYLDPDTASRIVAVAPSAERVAEINSNGATGAVLWIGAASVGTASAAKSIADPLVDAYNKVRDWVEEYQEQVEDGSVEPCVQADGTTEEYDDPDCGGDIDKSEVNIDCDGTYPHRASVLPNAIEIIGGQGTHKGALMNYVDVYFVLDEGRLSDIGAKDFGTAIEWQLKMWSEDVELVDAEPGPGLQAAGTVPDFTFDDDVSEETTQSLVTVCPSSLDPSDVQSIRYWFKWDVEPGPPCTTGEGASLDPASCGNYFAFDVVPSRRCEGGITGWILHDWNADSVWNCADKTSRVVGQCRSSPQNLPRGNSNETECFPDGQSAEETCQLSAGLSFWSDDYQVRVYSDSIEEVRYVNVSTLFCGNGECESGQPGSNLVGEDNSNCPEDCSVDECGAGGTAEDDTSPLGPCSGLASGWYCASVLPGYEGDADDLVRCQAGVVAESTVCADGCIENPSGVHDECRTSSSDGWIRVTHPDGGEEFTLDEEETFVAWDSEGTSGTVKIEFFRGTALDGTDEFIVAAESTWTDNGLREEVTFYSDRFTTGDEYYVCVSDADEDGEPWGCGGNFSIVASGDTGEYDDNDGDGYDSTLDCDDTNESTFPGATEVCDGVDNDCDGLTDEGVSATYYRDADSDGYGNAAVSTAACSAPSGYVGNDDDCDDASSADNPAATEIVGNSDDENCDGVETCYDDDDDDGYLDASGDTRASADTDCADANEGTSADSTDDCDDANISVSPGASEVCDNGEDDNCDGSTDESCGGGTLTVEYVAPSGAPTYITFYGELTDVRGSTISGWTRLEEVLALDTLTWASGPLDSGDVLRSSIEFEYGSSTSWGCVYDSVCGDPADPTCYTQQGTVTADVDGIPVTVELTDAPYSDGCEFTFTVP